MKKTITRKATQDDLKDYCRHFLKEGSPHDLRMAGYVAMSDSEIYHYFLDSPVTDYRAGDGVPFQLIVDESAEVPRLTKVKIGANGKKCYLIENVSLRDIGKNLQI